MTTYRHYDKEFMDRMQRIDITDYVQTFLLHIRKQRGVSIKYSYFGGATYLKQLLNAPEYTVRNTLETLNGFFYWNTQKVDIVPSNLGENKGYLFYFICIGCDRRAKYLYKYKTYDMPLCRICCKLGYVPPSRKARNISRLIRKPYLPSEAKYMLAKYAGITKEDLPEENMGTSKGAL